MDQIPSTTPPAFQDDLMNDIPGTQSPTIRHEYEHLRRFDDTNDGKPSELSDVNTKINTNTKRKADSFDDIFTPLEDNELDIEADQYE